MSISPPLSAAADAELFRLLGDETRLRMLRVLARERLNLSELVRILGLAQSTVSRHVGRLREAGLVVEAREGGWTWLTLPDPADGALGDLASPLASRLARAPDAHGDDARLSEVLREREERRVGWGRDGRSAGEPGRSWSAWARALGHLLPALSVADLGCGDGPLTLEVARWASSVVGVEPDGRAIARARALARRRGVENVTWMRGSLERLPLPDDHFDVALLSQTLHARKDPAACVAEAARVTRPGGRVLVLELRSHEEAWVQERLGHQWLGFEAERVGGWFAAAGLEGARLEEAARRRGNPFVVLVASAEKPRERRNA